MPITPIHIIAAVPLKVVAPKYFSLLWFSIVNILIDIEVIFYYFATGLPRHKFFHSIIGVSVIGVGCFIISILLKHKKISSFFGCIVGAYSHHIMDYFYHNWGTYGMY